MSPFELLLEKSKAIHLKKRADYTTNPESNPHENFERANEIINWFPSEYKSFASHIGTKLARLGSLLSGNKVPNNESLDDSFLDLVTYCGLMYDFYKRKQTQKHMNEVPEAVFAQPNPRTWTGFGKELQNSPKYKDSPDPTEPAGFGYIERPPQCWHNLVSMDSHRCLNCGLAIQKATDQYFYKPSDNPLYSHLLVRKT